MGKHASGRKVTDNHSTIIDAVEPVIKAARSIPSVRGATSVQELKLYTDDPNNVEQLLKESLGKRFRFQ